MTSLQEGLEAQVKARREVAGRVADAFTAVDDALGGAFGDALDEAVREKEDRERLVAVFELLLRDRVIRPATKDVTALMVEELREACSAATRASIAKAADGQSSSAREYAVTAREFATAIVALRGGLAS